jgi:two-component system response regulator NreC
LVNKEKIICYDGGLCPYASMNQVRILIADHHELVRHGLIEVLQRMHPEWLVVAEASSGLEAMERAEALRPNVAIVDLSVPEFDGREVTEHLVRSIPGIKVLVLTIHCAAPVLKLICQAGAAGFLAKNEAPGTMVEVLEQILAGAPFIASASASRPAHQLQDGERVPVQYMLTPRELEVLRQIALGHSNREIASMLQLSGRTVETHRANIMDRLRVGSLGELVKLAIQDGLA